MFDIGFTELLLIGVVALVVVGPEKLPGVIRTGLQYFRQFKSSFAHVREEVERELALDDLKKDFDDTKSQAGKVIGYDDLHESLSELRKEADSLGDIDDWGDDDDDSADANIEADVAKLSDDIGPKLPDADAEADTGIEIPVETKSLADSARPAAKAADTAAKKTSAKKTSAKKAAKKKKKDKSKAKKKASNKNKTPKAKKTKTTG